MKVHARSILHILMLLALGASLLGSALTVTPARADSTITVSTTTDEYADPGPGTGCSLREAITAANTNATYGGCAAGTGADTITVPAGTYTLAITGTGEDANTTGDLDITADLTINGAGASATTLRAGSLGYPDGGANGIDRVLQVFATVSISNLKIANGKCDVLGCDSGGGVDNVGNLTVTNSVLQSNIASYGGGIENEAGRTLLVENTSFLSNSAFEGGGIENDGTLLTVRSSTFSLNHGDADSGGILNTTTMTMANSTFSGNTAPEGGGLRNVFGTATVVNSTFSGNSTSGNGAGIYSDGTLNLANTILANSSSGVDCYNDGAIGTNVQNLIEINGGANACGTPSFTADPVLDVLGDHGGPTPTMSLLIGSPAINAGDDSVCAASPVNGTSQNSVARPQGSHCDIGAYEAQPQNTGPSFEVNDASDTYDGFCDTLGEGYANQDCTLRDAITAANQHAAAATIITVPGGTYTLALTGTGEDANATGDFDVREDVTINGAGASTTTIRAGATGYPSPPDGLDRVLHVAPGKALHLFGVTVANGHCNGTCSGGGIKNEGTLIVTASTFSGNTADEEGGGISNEGTLNVTDSAFSGNAANDKGGGIFNAPSRILTITESTFTDNNAGGFGNGGGGVWNQQGTVTLTNSTFSGNGASAVSNFRGTLTVLNSTFSGNTGAPAADIYSGDGPSATLNMSNTILANPVGGAVDCYYDGGTLGTNVKNLIETNGGGANDCGTPSFTADPVLGALALNGGMTPNFALLAGSSAINTGDDTACTNAPVNGLDQRGVTRPQGPHCDIGAYERGGGIFQDVPVPGKEWMQPWIDAFYNAGITTGCNPSPLSYCPENQVTRAEMAVFLLRATHGGGYGPPAATHNFADVPVLGKEWMEPWIDQFNNEGITTGCGGGNYCPENNVTRAEMAVFVLRALHGGGYAPPSGSGVFADVPVTGKEWMEPWIIQFRNEGITTGCGGGNYCPENNVTRAEMAVFIGRAYHLHP